MSTYLFTIHPANYRQAERALKKVGCWLEGPKEKATVTTAACLAHVRQEVALTARRALQGVALVVKPEIRYYSERQAASMKRADLLDHIHAAYAEHDRLSEIPDAEFGGPDCKTHALRGVLEYARKVDRLYR